ncbi:trafficking protein particle complex subunit 10-like isoform X2 [Gigantopelta aegis]|uniref:trafficking protein particle complex subunit 10-like isoform X2 n=1 Tax=Gigantopelta aegis TaxID=1735272 RepID=UPI001B88CDD0|nr:trafficking protein particle complex subunit 10-like isoform X2 [Gigantopelta aegis]
MYNCMMEGKPIVTCHGDQELFSQLHTRVVQGLPKEPTEWKRSYGRPPRTLTLEASFVPYDADILTEEDEPVLVSRPYFHIFWTACDLESYKQTVKDELAEWQAVLKNKNIPDWLIVVVVKDESKVKTKLLPRASVLDKVKSDFCGKNSDRCIVLTEPLKTEQKSVESWNNFFVRLRNLLLTAYSRQMTRFENNMRTLREKRNEKGWNYHEYFIVQEELAFMLEMLGVWEDALVQYDELDAMFAQFVENHAAGALCKWLYPLIGPCTNWAGLSLAKQINYDMRDLVKHNKASLLEFRDYLFSRQCALLFELRRPWEAAKRALNYLHSTIQEMMLLEVEVPEGALACWVFLSCLEVLNISEKHSDKLQIDKYSLYTASLWDHARKKLKELGNVCGLTPGDEPTSQQLSRRVDLASGMLSKEQDTDPGKKLRPVDRLRQALSSNNSFKKHYLEICELAMGTYKHIGRFRSSRIIGRDLADFYIKMNELQKAETFLQDTIKMYQQEGWQNLADGTMLELAQCQKNMQQPQKYLKTACQISCSHNLKTEERKTYFHQVMELLSKQDDKAIYSLKSSGIFTMEEAVIVTPSVSLSEDFVVDLKVTNHFPQTITCNKVSISVIKCKPDQPPNPSLFTQKKICHIRTPSLTNGKYEHLANFQPIKKQLPAELEFVATIEKKEDKITGVGVTCVNDHELLKRLDSNPQDVDSDETTERGDYSMGLLATNITLAPGENTIQLIMKCEEESVFHLRQLCVQLKQMYFLKSLTSCGLYFRVVCHPPAIHLNPVNSEMFLMGIEQEAVLEVNTGSLSLSPGDQFELFPTSGVDLTVIGDLVQNVAVGPNKLVKISVTVFCEENSESDQNIEKQILCHVTAWNKTLETTVTFVHPFEISHKLHTSKERKYIQLTVQGSTVSEFKLSRPELCALTADVDVYLMNNPTQQLTVSNVQAANYVWQVKCNTAHVSAVEMGLTVDHTCVLDMAGLTRRHAYSFSIHNFQTRYLLTYDVLSVEDKRTCKVGKMCSLEVKVKSTELAPQDERLVYKVSTGQQAWAVSGKSTEVFKLTDGCYKNNIDVLPLRAGFIHLPRVFIYKYSKMEANASAEKQADEKPKMKTDQSEINFEEFDTGEVYDDSGSKQVHVKPEQCSNDVEISVVS